MDSVTATKEFDGDARAMADRCHHLDARKAWPGAVLMGGSGGVLYYQVSMRLKAAAMTDIDIEETESPIEEGPDGTVRFTSAQKVTWPDGQAHAETEYTFGHGTMTFTYRYEAPSHKLVKAKALPAFHEGMQKVADRYVNRLTTPVSA
jgi:hypothetical protein